MRWQAGCKSSKGEGEASGKRAARHGVARRGDAPKSNTCRSLKHLCAGSADPPNTNTRWPMRDAECPLRAGGGVPVAFAWLHSPASDAAGAPVRRCCAATPICNSAEGPRAASLAPATNAAACTAASKANRAAITAARSICPITARRSAGRQHSGAGQREAILGCFCFRANRVAALPCADELIGYAAPMARGVCVCAMRV